ncbi:hypothetical protein OH77DRAFT_718999 [Trametes cingulata]|nr:hypothetical protein OH77DRAFT_718999 [Trametes cingulata]
MNCSRPSCTSRQPYRVLMDAHHRAKAILKPAPRVILEGSPCPPRIQRRVTVRLAAAAAALHDIAALCLYMRFVNRTGLQVVGTRKLLAVLLIICSCGWRSIRAYTANWNWLSLLLVAAGDGTVLGSERRITRCERLERFAGCPGCFRSDVIAPCSERLCRRLLPPRPLRFSTRLATTS